MTTKVTVSANHGWPVDVTPLPTTADGPVGTRTRVPAGETREFYVHYAQALLIHEVQPAEIAVEAGE